MLPVCGFHSNEAELTDGIKYFNHIPNGSESSRMSSASMACRHAVQLTVSEPSCFSQQLQSWHGPPPPFFPPTNINYRLGWGELPRERLRWDPVHWISWLSVLVRIWNSTALPFSIHKAWHRLYSSLTWLTGLREPQRRCQFIRLDPRLFHIMLISWTFTLKWSLKIKD